MASHCITIVSTVLYDRWTALAAGAIVESVSGSSYAFGVYSSTLQVDLNLTLSQINAMASAGNVGYYTNFFAGLSFDAFGPLRTGLAGITMSLVGYSLFAAYSDRRLPTSVAGLAFATFLWGHGAGYADTAALATSVRNFPRDRGLVVGLLRAFFGLSAAILSLYYSALFRPDVPGFLRFLSFYIPTTAACGILSLKLAPAGMNSDHPMSAEERRRVLIIGYGLAVVLGGYLLTVAVAQDLGALLPAPWLAIVTIPLLFGQVLLIVPWRARGTARTVRPPEQDLQSSSPANGESAGLLQTSPEPLLGDLLKSNSEFALLQAVDGVASQRILAPASIVNDGARTGLLPGGSLTDNILSFDFLLIFVVFLTVPGSGSECQSLCATSLVIK